MTDIVESIVFRISEINSGADQPYQYEEGSEYILVIKCVI